MNVWVKICGTTSVKDAEVAVRAGANALGFVFAASPRRISPADARSITATLPENVQRVGVFVNETPEHVREVAAAVRLTAVQLHGDETPDYVRHLFRDERPQAGSAPERRRGTMRIFKAIAVGANAASAADRLREFSSNGDLVDAFLLDSAGTDPAGTDPVNQVRGGSGKPFDQDAAAELCERFAGRARFIVAGGLRPGNVADAIRKLQPWGVDVVSGVEQQPGVKDEAAVRSFIRRVREVEATL